MRFLPFMVVLALVLPASAETLELSLTQKDAIRQALSDSKPGFCAASSFFIPGTSQLGDIPRAAFSLACLGGALLLPSALQTQTNALVVGYLLAGGWSAYCSGDPGSGGSARSGKLTIPLRGR